MPATRPPAIAARANWRAAASPGGLIGLLCLLACLVLAFFLVARVLPGQEMPGMRAVLVVFTVVVGALALTMIYLLYGYFTLTYTLDRQALTIRWGWSRYTVPLAAVEYVGPASQVLGAQRAGASVPWPGYYLESYPLDEGVSIRTFATQPLHRQVVVCTADALYALSPERPVRFMEELVRQRERTPQAASPAAGAPSTGGRFGVAARQVGGMPDRMPAHSTQQLPVVGGAAARRRARPTPARAGAPVTETITNTGQRATLPGRRLSTPPALLRDRLAQILLVGAIMLNAGMVAYIIWRLPFAPERIPLHFNALGQVDRIGQPGEIFVLPAITVGVVLVNSILALSVQRYDTFAARLLLAGPIVTGVVAWVAVMNLL